MLKRWCLAAFLLMLAGLLMKPVAVAEESDRSFRQQNGLLARYAEETCGDYCAGCGRLCSNVLSGRVPINDVMRCLMYYHCYRDLGLARSTFETLPTRTRALLTRMDFSEAEKSCPRSLPIGRLMREAATLLA